MRKLIPWCCVCLVVVGFMAFAHGAATKFTTFFVCGSTESSEADGMVIVNNNNAGGDGGMVVQIILTDFSADTNYVVELLDAGDNTVASFGVLTDASGRAVANEHVPGENAEVDAVNLWAGTGLHASTDPGACGG